MVPEPHLAPSGRGWRRWVRHPELAVVVVLALALRLRLAGSRAPITYDDGVYLASVGAMRRGGLPFRDVFSSQGPAFLPILWIGDRLSGQQAWGPRVAPVAAALVLVVVVHRLTRRVGDRTSAALAAGIVATSGWVLFSTERIESDGVAAALAAGAVLAATGGNRWRRLGAPLLIGLALAVKSLFAVPALLAVLWLVARRDGLRAAATGVAVAASVTLALALLWGMHDVWDQSVGLHLAVRGGLDVGDNLRLVRTSVRRREPVLVWMTVVAAAAGGVRAALGRSHRSTKHLHVAGALWIWLIGALAVLLTHHPLQLQQLMVVVPPAAVLVAAHRPPAAAVVAVAVLTIPAQAHGGAWTQPAPVPEPAEADAIDRLARIEPADATVISDEPALPWLADRASPGSMVDVSFVRIAAGDLTVDDVVEAAAEPDVCAVLLWTGRLASLPGLAARLTDYHVARRWGSDELLLREGCRLTAAPAGGP